MKNIRLLLIASLILLQACIVPSFYPLYELDEFIYMDELSGEWIGKNSIWIFEKGESGYNLTYRDCPDPINHPSSYSECTAANFNVRLVKLNDTYYMDFFPSGHLNSENQFLKFHLRSFHSFAKVEIKDEEVKLFLLSFQWIEDKLKTDNDLIDHVKTENGIVLTAKTHELRDFMSANSNNDEAFLGALVLKKRAEVSN